MTPYNRVLLVVGGAAVIVSLAIAVIFVQADLAAASLRTDEEVAFRLQVLGDSVLAEVHEQRESIDEYLMTADPRMLARYRQAVTNETRTSGQIRVVTGNLTGVADALAKVDSENDAWRATIADPAIAAVQSGSAEAVQAAMQTVIQDEAATQAVAKEFGLQIDAVLADLDVRSDALNGLRVASTAFGVAIELLAAGLSLWFVRRYGHLVARDARLRVQASAERVAIMASLRTLRTQQTPEATATIIAEALSRLPGVDVAGVFECTEDGLVALAIVGLPEFPTQTGEAVPAGRARYFRDRSGGGPWAERWIRPSEPDAYDERLAALGIKSRAFAPIRTDGRLIGLIEVATTDEGHWRHLVDDLPAVGEFASVAETILAPAMVAHQDREEKRRRIGATIASAAFRSVFQPIVDLASGGTVGFEALTRFDDGARPDITFATARQCGMGIELEAVTLELALREGRHLVPPGAWLSLNVSPPLLAHEGTLGRMLTDRSRPVVLEITEHEAIEAYAPLREAMLRLGPGVRLAVDDVGAGVANFAHLVELRPNFIKIDVGLVRGVDLDPSRRGVIAGLVQFAAEVGCQVIAEGIETEAERATVAKLGVKLAQGYLLARPAPAEAWSLVTQKPGDPVPLLPQVVRRSGPSASRASRPVVAAATVRPD
jgi:EAL domain-containing protein (putative c-di-GMP-specific phosphodiesterase class I)/CHASE3 domain sensor protein